MSNPRPLPFEAVWEPHHRGLAFWIFDLDGTLIDIAPRPDAVVVPSELLEDLQTLSRQSGGHVAVVSGRSITDLAARFPMSDLILVGNHGAEWREGKNQRVLSPDDAALKGLAALRPQLQRLSEAVPNLLVEDKVLTLSVHVRHVAPALQPTVKEALEAWIAREPALTLRPARACWEIRPRIGATKGDAVSELLARQSSPLVPLIFGDDVTDEDAFLAAPPNAVTVIVGPRRPTQARYALNTPSDLRKLLREIGRLYT
ncbi:MAG: trehalose-phosphatase [Firmicutes bacterium]|nr:trehalose-phosphatase [Bacillota bacterium]